MRTIGIGNELDSVETELRNIIFIAEKTVPVEGADPKAGDKMIADMARRALKCLAVAQPHDPRSYGGVCIHGVSLRAPCPQCEDENA